MPGFAGFDTDIYPGDAVMDFLIGNSNLKWCGFYLAPAPSHRDRTWMGTRANLQAAGWGVAPVYVGQQVTGPGSKKPSADQGTTDGADAANLMAAEGFAPGSYAYLDIENGPPLTKPQKDYLVNWSAAIVAGGYKAGIYCSYLLAVVAHNLVPDARVWVFKVSTIKPHPVPNPFPDPNPALSTYIGAYGWQLGQNCLIDAGGDTMLAVDLDSAITVDPGAPDS